MRASSARRSAPLFLQAQPLFGRDPRDARRFRLCLLPRKHGLAVGFQILFYRIEQKNDGAQPVADCLDPDVYSITKKPQIKRLGTNGCLWEETAKNVPFHALYGRMNGMKKPFVRNERFFVG